MLNSQVCATSCACSAKGMKWLSQVKREPNYALKITTSNEILAYEKTPQANLQSYYGTKPTPHTKKSKAKLRFILLALLTSRSSISLLLGALVGCNNDGQGMSTIMVLNAVGSSVVGELMKYESHVEFLEILEVTDLYVTRDKIINSKIIIV